MRKVFTLLTMLSLMALAIVPGLAQDDQTIVDIAVAAASNEEAPEFTVLVDAVVSAWLVDALAGEGPFTVFAPTDAAFAAALEALGLTAEELLADTETLTNVLLYHVVPGEFYAEDVAGLNGETVPTLLEGDGILIRAGEEGVMVDNANVIQADIAASNGVIHVIDSVILPDGDPTIVDIAVAAASDEEAPQFTVLVDAVVSAGLVDALAGEGPFTVFAPTDEAFAAALEALGLTAEELLADTETLTNVLLYHVVPGKYTAADVVANDGYSLPTLLENDGVAISVSDDGVMVDSANVISTDIFGSNGVIHVIDAVILPDGETGEFMPMDEMMDDEDMMPSIAEIVVAAASNEEAPEFTTLLAAVQAAGLTETLMGEGTFTVFAPTDAAFAAALEALGISAEDLLADTETLTSILTYHVLGSVAMEADVAGLDGVEVETLNGATISISVTDDGVFLNGSVQVILTDIEASNGVIHVIDAVLLPPTE